VFSVFQYYNFTAYLQNKFVAIFGRQPLLDVAAAAAALTNSSTSLEAKQNSSN
jgi:hypothetical protein